MRPHVPKGLRHGPQKPARKPTSPKQQATSNNLELEDTGACCFGLLGFPAEALGFERQWANFELSGPSY